MDAVIDSFDCIFLYKYKKKKLIKILAFSKQNFNENKNNNQFLNKLYNEKTSLNNDFLTYSNTSLFQQSTNYQNQNKYAQLSQQQPIFSQNLIEVLYIYIFFF